MKANRSVDKQDTNIGIDTISFRINAQCRDGNALSIN